MRTARKTCKADYVPKPVRNIHLDPQFKQRIDVYKRPLEGEPVLHRTYYNCDLNEISKRLHSEAFIHKERYKIVTLDGYVEYVR